MKSVKLKNGLLVLGMFVAYFAVSTSVLAQDSEVSDDELMQYAKVSATIDVMKVEMKEKINITVKSNELMEGGKRYNKLNKAKKDKTIIAESVASEEQLAAFAEIQESIIAFKAEFKTSYTAVVKNDIGASVFNKVKKALKADEAVKVKYDEIVASLSERVEYTEGE